MEGVDYLGVHCVSLVCHGVLWSSCNSRPGAKPGPFAGFQQQESEGVLLVPCFPVLAIYRGRVDRVERRSGHWVWGWGLLLVVSLWLVKALRVEQVYRMIGFLRLNQSRQPTPGFRGCGSPVPGSRRGCACR